MIRTGLRVHCSGCTSFSPFLSTVYYSSPHPCVVLRVLLRFVLRVLLRFVLRCSLVSG